MEPEGSLPSSQVRAFAVYYYYYYYYYYYRLTIPAGRNVVQKEAEKKLKYNSLCTEIQRMWNLKCTIIPVTTGATGVVTKSLKKNLEAIPVKHSIDSVPKTAMLSTSHSTESTAV
jgi:hypothetical protein